MDATVQPLQAVARPTTIIESPRLSQSLGCAVTLASETFQLTGSFKFRAAYNLASKAPEKKLIAASSGNFGQALAYACRLLGKTCIVVMPDNSAAVKIAAVRDFGGIVELVETKSKSRSERVRELAAEHPDACVASAYDDLRVIEGNASLGAEIAALPQSFDYVVAPIGGGGLCSGVVEGLRQAGKTMPQIYGAEPLLANDAAQSLAKGELVKFEHEAQTIADGARTLCLGEKNWEILRRALTGIVTVGEEHIEEGVRRLFHLANLKSEPTGALTVGALLASPDLFAGSRVLCVVSGGNVDWPVMQRILDAGNRT